MEEGKNHVSVEKTEASPALREFSPLAQCRASNLLQRKLTEKVSDPTQIDFNGDRTIESIGFRLFIKGYSELAKTNDPLELVKKSVIPPTVAMLLDCLMIVATTEGLKETLVMLSLKKYMAMRGLTDKKATRKQLRLDISVLEQISFEYQRKNNTSWLKVYIAGETSKITNEGIIFRFSEDFFNVFKEYNAYSFMYFPHESFRIKPNINPYAYWFLRKISEHKRMNLGEPNEDVISVKTLIEACPNYPTYEDVKKSNRAITKRLIAPFVRDMERLEQIFSWEYNSDGRPQKYMEFMATTIKIHWKNYPDTPEIRKLIARKKARKENLIMDRKKRKKKGVGAVSG